MAYCKKCGNKLDHDADFCTECGTPVSTKETGLHTPLLPLIRGLRGSDGVQNPIKQELPKSTKADRTSHDFREVQNASEKVQPLKSNKDMLPHNSFSTINETAASSRSNHSDNYKTQIRNKSQTYGIVNLENLPIEHTIDDRYDVIQKLGQGGFGAVYRVHDLQTDRELAIKIMDTTTAAVTQEDAKRLLQAIERKEKAVQDKVKKAKAKAHKVKVEKDW